MKPFAHARARDARDAVVRHGGAEAAHYLAGGTTQLDLMKLGVLAPERLVDLAGLRDARRQVEDRGDWLRLDAFMTMRQAAASPLLAQKAPVVVETLTQAASRQLRAMATLGGNVLQRTRCGYYRDLSWPACNRRAPGSGCAAIAGTAWAHAVLGGSAACIAVYPGDFAQALVALEAVVELEGPQGARLLPFAQLHRLPGAEPHRETELRPGELIAAFRLPLHPWFARSRYVKVRDRASYEFALASAAVALDLDGGVVRDARIALGGGATVPWRARAAEDALRGQAFSPALAHRAAQAAYAAAAPRPGTEARLTLGRATLARALIETATMELPHG